MKQSISRRDFLRISISGAAVLAAAPATGALSCAGVNNRFDIILRSGTIFNGDATPSFVADLGIRDGRIVAIGQLGNDAATIIDCTGLAVCPGFIDIHSHTDTNWFDHPAGDSKLYQGLTLDVGGNCGDSPFPKYKKGELYQLKDFYNDLKANKTGINYATYAGQGQLRSIVVGDGDVAATEDQIKEMEKILSAQMEMGCMGLSCGLEYAPGAYASNAEIVRLLKVVAHYNGLFAIHMRNEDDRVEEAVEEALSMAREAGVRLEISHLKAQNFANWHKGPALLSLIEKAALNQDVGFDCYPYTAFSTGLNSFIPLALREGETDTVLARLNNEKTATEIGNYADSRFARLGGPKNVLISSVGLEEDKVFMGKNLEECAAITGKSVWETVRHILIKERMAPQIVAFAMSEENVKAFLAHPLCVPISDGSVYAPSDASWTMPHPRSYGTFPRFLGKYCIQEKILDLPQAVRHLSAIPAQRLRLKERGRLVPGYFADITVFDPATIMDTATFENPHQFPTGIRHLIVNGAITLQDGKYNGELKGSCLVPEA